MMQQRWLGVGVGLCSVLLGCTAPPLKAPSEGGAGWHQLSSEHFVLRTNATVDRAQQVVRDFERGYWVMAHLAFPYDGGELPSRTPIVMFADIENLEPLGHAGVGGALVIPPLGIDDEPFLVIPADAVDRPATREIFYHELTHRFVHQHFPAVPLWLNEGLAEYYSTAEIGGTWVKVGQYLERESFGDAWGWGRTDGEVWLLIPRSEVVALEQLKQESAADFYGDYDDTHADKDVKHRALSYASAWAAVHALHLVPDGDQRFSRYLAAMNRGEHSETEAFGSAFGDLPPDAVGKAEEQVIGQHATDVVTYSLKAVPEPAPARVERLSQARVQLVLYEARAYAHGQSEQQITDLNRAVGLDPHDPETLRARGIYYCSTGKLDRALEDLERAHEVAPDVARYTQPLALALLGVCGEVHEESAHQGELERISGELMHQAKTAAEWNALAQIMLRSRAKLGAARQFAERGVRANPACFYCYITLAETAAARKDFAAAAQHQSRALATMPDAIDHAPAARQLEAYRKQLAASVE